MDDPILVSLGSNIEPELNLPRAIALLAERLVVRALSAVYVSPPAGGAVGPPFHNAAVWLVTDLPPAALKREVLRPVEARLGRVRGADKNAPRTIDLDLALYGGRVIDDPAHGLVLPDPGILVWPHVALPLADLAPDFAHPVAGRTLGEIAAGLAGAGGLWQKPWRGIE
jgi:2-amino-4-hydroxy-6-hydroxymethyldihydropteridine diphosphokinase